MFVYFFFKCNIANIKIILLFLGPFQHFFSKYLFFKFISKCQKEILRCAPLSSHVCNFLFLVRYFFKIPKNSVALVFFLPTVKANFQHWWVWKFLICLYLKCYVKITQIYRRDETNVWIYWWIILDDVLYICPISTFPFHQTYFSHTDFIYHRVLKW